MPDAVTPSPGPTASGEGTIANILGGVIPSPDETEQPIDGRAKIAEIASGQGGDIVAVETPAVETPAAEETLAPNIQYTIDLIEAILQNPAREAKPSAPPEEAATPETVVGIIPDVEETAETSAQPDVAEAGTASPAPSSETSAEPTAPGEEGAKPAPTDTGEVTSSPVPLVEATEVVSATAGAEPTPTPQILEPTPLPEEATTVPEEEETQPTETDAPSSPQDAPAVIITSVSDDEVVGIGSTITLTSQVTGVPDGTMLVYQWQNDASGAYENVPGATSSTYTYVVDEETNNCDWRVQVQVIME